MLLLVAMVGMAASVRSWGASLAPSVREKVQQAWAARLVVPLMLALNESILFEAVLVQIAAEVGWSDCACGI